jgi:hypothetical protein
LREGLPQLGDVLGRLLWEGWALIRLYTGRTTPRLSGEGWASCTDAEAMVWNVQWLGQVVGLKRTALAAELLRAASAVEDLAEAQDVLAQFGRRLAVGREEGGAGLPVRSTWGGEVTPDELEALAPVVREIFGNPFCPVAFSPSWRTTTAVALARQMYESRGFGAMPILADAIQDAGCDNEDILNHCCVSGVHVRGCWVVDLVLGKV